jgi:hypothetical protein
MRRWFARREHEGPPLDGPRIERLASTITAGGNTVMLPVAPWPERPQDLAASLMSAAASFALPFA